MTADFVRLEVADGVATITNLTFRLADSGVYRNSAAVVHLYDHLLAGARAARRAAVTPTLMAADAVVTPTGLVGPFRLVTSDAATVTVAGGHSVVDADGAVITEPVVPHHDFFLLVSSHSGAATLTVEIPGDPRGFGGRVITGVARDEVAGTYTPLALAVPVQHIVEFEIQ